MTTNASSAPVGARQNLHCTNGKSLLIKVQPTKPLPTARIAFDKQVEILRAYPSICGAAPRPVSHKEVASLVALSPDTVKFAPTFFAAIGLLKRGENGYEPCQELFAYFNASRWQPETAFHKLAPVFEQTWFSSVLLPKLRFKEISTSQAIEELAAASSASPEFQAHLRLALRFLEESGIILVENGIVKLGNVDSAAQAKTVVDAQNQNLNGHVANGELKIEKSVNRLSTAFERAAQGAIQLNIDINVDMNEMAKWKPERITAFLAGLAAVLAAKGDIERKESVE